MPLQDSYNSTYLTYGIGGNFATPASDDNVDDGLINWTDLTTSLGDLAPGDSLSVDVWFTALEDTTALPNGETTNTATVIGAVPDPDGPNGPLPPRSSPLPIDASTAGVAILLPTGLGVYGLTATPLGMDVVVRWKTASEASIIGFKVLRSVDAGDFSAISPDVIAAESSGSNSGNAYLFLDKATSGLAPVAYKLEVVGVDGSIEEVGPAYLELQRLRAFTPLYLRAR